MDPDRFGIPAISGTPEQKFLLMLVERLDAAEADVAKLKRICGIDQPPPVISTRTEAAQAFYDELCEQKRVYLATVKQDEEALVRRKLPAEIPLGNMSARVLDQLVHLLNAISMQKAYFCMTVMEAHVTIGDKMVTWLREHLAQFAGVEQKFY